MIVAPMMTWPILTLSIILILTSIVLALFILLHKGRGGGMSDLFGGGMTTSMGGTSVAERNLDRITIVVGAVWLFSVLGLLTLYRFFPEVGSLNAEPAPAPAASQSVTPSGTPTPSATPTGSASTPTSSPSASNS